MPTATDPLYAAALREDRLPPNIRINEFFLLAGASLANKRTQRSYIGLNYSHLASHLERVDTNVFAQLVAPHPAGSRVSLSSNTDVTLDLLPYIRQERKSRRFSRRSSMAIFRICQARRKSSARSSTW